MTKYFECQVKGIDAQGFAWENVFCVTAAPIGAETDWELEGLLNTFLSSTLASPYQAAMNQNAELLAFTTRGIYTNSFFTRVLPNAAAGDRVGNASMGAVCGRIVFLPTGGPGFVSSMFINCGEVTDFNADTISPAYQTLLEAIGDAYIGIDGSDASYHWQFSQFHKLAPGASNLDSFYISPNPTTLNKRMRA